MRSSIGLVRACRRVDDIADADDAERRHAGRYPRAYTDVDGMVVVSARLAPEAGAALLRAIEAARDALHGAQGLLNAGAGDLTGEQRRAQDARGRSRKLSPRLPRRARK